MNQEINLDHAAQSTLHPEVVDAMVSVLGGPAANPSSDHPQAMEAKEAIDAARASVAGLLGATPREVLFTSSGTESNNLALKGTALHPRRKGSHLVVSAIEHFSVLNAARSLKNLGIEVTELPVDSTGLVDPDDLKKALRDDTFLVSIMHANNEIGAVQNLKELAHAAKERGCLFHSDGVAAAGLLESDVRELGVDMYSIAGNPLGGPQGTGALFVRKGVSITPLLHGGVQERGLRSGTENVAGIVGLGKAAQLTSRGIAESAARLSSLRDELIRGVESRVPDVYLTGPRTERLPNHASFIVRYIEGEAILISLMMEGIIAASGSSCTARDLKISHVLKALGVDHAQAQGSVVFTLGLENTREHVQRVIEAMPPIVERLRSMSPLFRSSTRSE